MSLNPTRLLAALAASLSLAAPSLAQTMPGTNPVKIFIVAGESNTSGKGTISPFDTPGTLDNIHANDTTGQYRFLKSGDNYVVRDDVWVRKYVTIAGNNPPTTTSHNLTTGLGSNVGLIGPEFGFGHVVGAACENQVLIVKVGVDAATLAFSFCPPSSRQGEPEPTNSSEKGFYYKEIIRLVNEAKNNLGTYFPGYTGGGYVIAGLGWHQGYNDRQQADMSSAYQTNMANFISDIRRAGTGLDVPNLPVVIATVGVDGYPTYPEVELAQLKMTDPVVYPDFVGNVAVVDTRQNYEEFDFWQSVSKSPANEAYHWNRSGKSYLHVGLAMGDAMLQLVPGRIPYRPRGSVAPAGATLLWKNGTEIPTSVRVLRNGVEIAAAAPANPPAFLDPNPPLGFSTYELQFTMQGNPAPPLSITINTGVTGLTARLRANGAHLAWKNNLTYAGLIVKRDGTTIATLPGSATSHVDLSPPGGARIYTVEPTTAGSAPAQIALKVASHPPQTAVIYEPFEMTPDTALQGKAPGIGLDDQWLGANINVTSGNLAYGTLPTYGNRIVRVTSNGPAWNTCGTTLADAGLLNDGAVLWFSFLSKNPNNTNAQPAFLLGSRPLGGFDKIQDNGSGIGLRIESGNKPRPTLFNAGVFSQGSVQATFASSATSFIVGKITWGATPSSPDTIEIYTPGTNLLLNSSPAPQSISAVLDQSDFSIVSMTGNSTTPEFDEIRFGATYDDVIGAGIDTSGDLTSPSPATMSFATPPAATSTTAITMTATTATDTNGVEYFFDETSGNPGGTDSDWQDSPVYTDTGLNPGTQYTYTVQARDKSVNHNTNTASSPASATTFAPDTTPPTPNPMSWATPPAATSTTAITMTASTASDDSGVEYFFDETSGNPGGTDSAWQDSPVYTDTGLNPNTQYTYTVQARDKSVNNNPNTASSAASATTFPPDANPPPTPGFSVAPNATSSSVITMTATTVTDPDGGAVEYLFTETSGNVGGSSSGWQSSPSYTDNGLAPNTQYTYTVKARDNASPPNESAASAPASATTPALPSGPALAKTLYWDGGDSGANAQGGTGIWDNSAANWDTLATAGADATWSSPNADFAVFGTPAGAVTLGAPITTSGMQFNVHSYSIAADTTNTLAFATGNNTIATNFTSAAGNITSINGTVGGAGANLVFAPANPGIGVVGHILSLGGASSGGWNGTTTIDKNMVVRLQDTNQALLNTSAIILRGGILTLTNIDTQAGLDRVNNSAPIHSYGGSIRTFNTVAAAAYGESMGELKLHGGNFTILQNNNQNTGGSQILSFSKITRESGSYATMNVGSSFGTSNIVRNLEVTTATPAGEIIGPWMIQGNTTSQGEYTAYNASGNIVGYTRPAANSISAETSMPTAWAGTANINFTGSPTLSANRVMNTLKTGNGATYQVADFSLATNGILAGGGNVTFSAPTGPGYLTAAGNPGSGNAIYLSSSNGFIDLSVPLKDNGNAVTLVLTTGTNGGRIDLKAACEHTGGTVISAPVFMRADGQTQSPGTVNLFNTNALGPNSTLLRMESGTLNLNAIAATVGKFEGDVSSFVTGTGGTIFTVGDSTAANVTADFAGTLAAVRLTKAGLGTQILSGVNTANNTTTQYTVNGGTLRFAKTSALMNSVDTNWTAAKIVVANGATLALNVGGPGEFTTGNITTLLTNLAASTSVTNGMNAGSNLAFDTTNASGGSFTIGAVIADTTGVSGGARGLAKLGNGTLVLTNSNTYTGPTIIHGGTLALGASNVLPNASAVSLGAATLDAATFSDTLGTLDVTGAATLNLGTGATLAFAASNSVNDGTWAGTLNINITGSLGANSIRFGTTATALTAGQLAKITVNGSGTYSLDSNGYLVTVSFASAYNAWAASTGLTGQPGSSTDPAKDADPDNDGRNNLGEFAFNGDPLSGSDNGKVFALTEDSDFDGDATKELILTIAVRTGTPTFTGSPLSAIHPSDGITYHIEGGPDLAGFTAAVNVVPTPVTNNLPAAGDDYEYRSFSLDGSNGLTGKGFLRAKVTSP